MALLVKNGKQNLSEDVLSVDLLKIEIILLRVKIFESEYLDDKGKTIHSLWLEINEKNKLIKGEKNH